MLFGNNVTKLIIGRSKTSRIFRSSRPEVFYKKGVLRNFTKFKGKHLCQNPFFKKRIWRRCFPVNFSKFLRTPFYIEHLRTTASEYSKAMHTVIPWNKCFWVRERPRLRKVKEDKTWNYIGQEKNLFFRWLFRAIGQALYMCFLHLSTCFGN